MFIKSKNVASILASYAVKLNATERAWFLLLRGTARGDALPPPTGLPPAFNWKTLKLNKEPISSFDERFKFVSDDFFS